MEIENKRLWRVNHWLQINSAHTDCLTFAGDVVLLADNLHSAQELQNIAAKTGLRISFEKIAFMVSDKAEPRYRNETNLRKFIVFRNSIPKATLPHDKEKNTLNVRKRSIKWPSSCHTIYKSKSSLPSPIITLFYGDNNAPIKCLSSKTSLSKQLFMNMKWFFMSIKALQSIDICRRYSVCKWKTNLKTSRGSLQDFNEEEEIPEKQILGKKSARI